VIGGERSHKPDLIDTSTWALLPEFCSEQTGAITAYEIIAKG